MLKLLFLVFILLDSNVECNQNWNYLINRSHDWSTKYSQEFKQEFQSIIKSNNISIECKTSFWETLTGIQNLEVWAIDMINSWGRFPPSGVRTGTSTDFGSYDQCLAIELNNIIGKPQYCLIDLKPPLPRPMPVHHNLHHRIDVLPKEFTKSSNKSLQNVFESYSEFASFFYWISLRTGICTPSKCSLNDISLMAKAFADNYGLELHRTSCETKPTETKLNIIQVMAICVIICAVLASLTATFWERFGPKKDNSKFATLLVDLFSLKQNIKSLFAKRSTEVFPCIHGIRVLTLVWVIFSHSTEWTNFQLYSRAFRVKTLFARVDNQLLLNGEYAVENFFFIGGMLTSFISFQFSHGKLSGLSIPGFIFGRYLRLTPQLIIFILLTFLLPLMASGPIWNETINPIVDTCYKNWWWNIFYLQNWFNGPDICGLHTWFLACDMQYHWISLLLIIPLLYKSTLGLFVTNFSIMAFYLTSVIIGFMYDIPPGLINTGRDEHFMKYYIDLFYYKPWSHSTVFFIGFLFGIIAYQKKFKKLSMAYKYLIFGIIVTGYVVCLMDTFPWSTGDAHDRLLSAFIYSSTRVIWAVSTAALIWMCISGNGGNINRFLSSQIFLPFSRLTYSVYLTHVWIVWIFVGTRRERIDTEWTEIVFIFLHNLIIAYIIGFLFTVLFELPVLRLQKRILSKFLTNDEKSENLQELRETLTKIPIDLSTQ